MDRARSPIGRPPSPADILAARESAGLTQRAAGALVCASPALWGRWERGTTRMHPAAWLLFRARLDAVVAARLAELGLL